MAESEGESRGARRRRERRTERQRREALRWWGKPGVLLFLAALALALAGWALVIRDTARIPVERATIEGLEIRLLGARWILDQMDHGENFQMPSTMMPDMPEWGKQRVTLDLMFFNHSTDAQVYDGSEFHLVPEMGDEVPPVGAQVGRAKIGPGQGLNTAIHFDFDTTEPHGKLRVAWRRQGDTVYLPIPEPAEHYHLRPRGGEVAFPPRAAMVMHLGDPERGGALFAGRYGCVACHGDPGVPGSNNVGPHLGGIATAGATRVEGLAASEYVYQSILEPGAFIAPECRGGRPCAEPTAMPEYASLLTLQDLADLMAYLMEQRGDGAAERAAGP
ncbi:MAG: c-type cytochrome [Acidobacteriota bacterium]|jgi:cytochrome c553